jgi:hypothetical protein
MARKSKPIQSKWQNSSNMVQGTRDHLILLIGGTFFEMVREESSTEK